MFSFFKKRPKTTIDFSALKTDMHSHLIPGIDDGAPDIETSLQLIKGLYDLGYRKLITTPHVMADLYPNTPTMIEAGLAQVQTALQATNLDIEIEVAAEYLLDEAFDDKLKDGQLLAIAGKYILVEMSFIAPSPKLDQQLFRLQTKGYTPILAHPERYTYMASDLSAYQRLKERGCLLQLNSLSLSGYYGSDVKDIAIKLIKHQLIDFLGTDLHHARHLAALQALQENKKISKLLAAYPFKNPTLMPN